jgi:hypothetical protein
VALEVSTSEESCFRVCVRLRDASARARVSSEWPPPPAAGVAVAAGEGGVVLGARGGGGGGGGESQQHSLARAAAAAVAAVVAAVAAAAAAAAAAASLRLRAECEGDECGERPLEGVTVDSCSWISIMWSPSRIVRFSGAFPDKKSFTCNTIKQNIFTTIFEHISQLIQYLLIRLTGSTNLKMVSKHFI